MGDYLGGSRSRSFNCHLEGLESVEIMPIEVQKEVTSTSEGPVSDQVSQTATTAQVSTNAEVQDAHSDRGNAWIW